METEIVETKKADKGFTLVELLIVIVILGILATVTVFAVRGITNQGKSSACAADKKTLQVAAEAYQAQNGSYPVDVNTMVTAGLLRDVSTNWTYAPVAATAAVAAIPAAAEGPGLDGQLGAGIGSGDPLSADNTPATAAVPAVAAGGANFTLTPGTQCV